MTNFNFYWFADLLRPFTREDSTKVCQDSLSFEKRLPIPIYYLTGQGLMKTTAHSFGITKCNWMCSNRDLYFDKWNYWSIFYCFPIKEKWYSEWKYCSCFLQKFRFLQVIGCVDGTHTLIKQPSENANNYFSYKLCFTLNCQAINVYGKFNNVETK